MLKYRATQKTWGNAPIKDPQPVYFGSVKDTEIALSKLGVRLSELTGCNCSNLHQSHGSISSLTFIGKQRKEPSYWFFWNNPWAVGPGHYQRAVKRVPTCHRFSLPVRFLLVRAAFKARFLWRQADLVKPEWSTLLRSAPKKRATTDADDIAVKIHRDVPATYWVALFHVVKDYLYDCKLWLVSPPPPLLFWFRNLVRDQSFCFCFDCLRFTTCFSENLRLLPQLEQKKADYFPLHREPSGRMEIVLCVKAKNKKGLGTKPKNTV